MVDHVAERVDAAGIATRIFASLAVARLVSRAILVDYALGVDANCCSVDDAALTVCATGGRVAGIGWDRLFGRFCAKGEGISN